MDSLPEYIEGTVCNSHRKVARLPTFKNFFSKCLEQTPERHVGAQSLLFTNFIHFLFNFGFFKGKRNTGNFSGITLGETGASCYKGTLLQSHSLLLEIKIN